MRSTRVRMVWGNPAVVAGPVTVDSGPSYMTVESQPTTGTDNTAFASQIVLQLRKADGSAALVAGVVVTVSIFSGTGALIGTVTATSDALGVVTFATDLGINDSTL